MTERSRHTQTPGMDEAVARLGALLIEENAALEAMDFARAGSLLAPKHAAADALAAAWRAADPANAVSDKMHELGVLAEENRQLLKRAMRVQRRVLDLVAKAARLPAPGGRYGAEGRPETARMHGQGFKTRA